MEPAYEIIIDPARGLLRITVSGFLSFDDLTGILREHAFHVRTRRSYGSRRLPRGHVAFIAERATTR